MLMTFRTVLDMLENEEKGVLVTVIDGTTSFKEAIGQNQIFKEGYGFLKKNSKEFSHFLANKLDTLCKQVLKKKGLKREKIQDGEEWIDIMLEPIISTPRLIILGCGHVGQSLAKLADQMELSLVAVDDRPDYANRDLFPAGTEILCRDFETALDEIDPKPNDFVVIVSRGHKDDKKCLEKLADRELGYIGMMGSKRRVNNLFEELYRKGIDQDWLEEVHSPIGLDIGAETPGEIAVSILAEIVQEWRKGA